MFVIIAIDIIQTLGLIITFLANLEILLTGHDVQTYSSANYQFDKFDLVKSAYLMTLDEAETFCALERAKLLYDLEGMDVNTIMNFMITDDIWVNLYK
jgi:hypothetical protein